MEFNASLITLFLASLIIFLYFLFFKLHKNGNLPPGSSGWPIIGETLEYVSFGSKGHPENFILDRVSQYSSDIFKTNLFGTKFAVFTGPTNNKFLFSNENKLVVGWFPKSIKKVFPSSSLTSSQEQVIVLRKMLPNFFKPEALQRYVGLMDTTAQRHFDLDWENKEHVTVVTLTNSLTCWLACRLFVSIDEPNHVAKFAATIALINQGIMSIPIDFPGTKFNRAIKASKSINKELRVIIKQRKVDLAEGKASPTQDILSHMLTTSDENGKFLQEADIANNILGLLIAGQDTTSFACASIVMYLAEFPHVYERVYKEHLEIAGKKLVGELLNWNDIKEMKYSWNVACEAMRLTPPVQVAFREAIADFTHTGFSFPKGMKILWSANSTGKNPEFFPEPWKFDPSRFEGSGPAPYTFVPFGGGPKMCPGREYARLEILVFMHHLVRRFKWEKVIPNEKIVVNPMPNPEKGLPIRLFPHKAC